MRHADLYVNVATPRCIELGRVRTRSPSNIERSEKRRENSGETEIRINRFPRSISTSRLSPSLVAENFRSD